MAGTCITSIKLVGVGSLGLLTGSLAYQSFQLIPKLIDELNLRLESGYDNLKAIKYGKYINAGLLKLTVGCLYLAYKYSPANEKHPYLIYSILGSVIGFGYTYYQTFNYEKRINSFEIPKPIIKAVANDEKPKESSTKESSTKEDDLSKSYIHVSDEESSTTNSTPPNSVPSSPNPNVNIDDEINLSLYKKQTVNNLNKIQSVYVVGSGVFAFTFFISSIGILGDLIMG